MPHPISVALDAHVVGRQKGGNETYALALAGGLAARPDIELFAYVDGRAVWPGDRPQGLHLRSLASHGPAVRIPVELPIRAALDRADLLHVQYVAPPIIRTPVVTAVHDVSFEDVPESFPVMTRIRLRTLVRFAIRQSAAIVTPSEFSRSRILHYYGVDPSRVFVTPLALPRALSLPDREAARGRTARLGLPDSFVLFVGQLSPRKNVARLVAATAEARARGAEVGLVLAGAPGREPEEVHAAIAAAGAEAWTQNLGYVDAPLLAALYATARVIAYPSLYEGFGLPVLEGMAAGVPVVASSTAAIPEVAGDAALLVDPTDVAALADAIVEAACNEATRARLSAAGPLRAARFTATDLAQSTVSAYRYALGR